MSDTAEIIERYLAAFKKANCRGGIDLAYVHGWFILSIDDGFASKYRKKQILAMTKRLESRGAECN